MMLAFSVLVDWIERVMFRRGEPVREDTCCANGRE